MHYRNQAKWTTMPMFLYVLKEKTNIRANTEYSTNHKKNTTLYWYPRLFQPHFV